MSRNLTASDRSSLIRLASSLSAKDPTRKAILAGLAQTKKVAGGLDASDVIDAIYQGMPFKKIHVGPEDLLDYAQKSLRGSSRAELSEHLEEAIQTLIKEGAMKMDGRWGLLITP